MDRERAHRLWRSTLALGLMGDDPESFEQLEALWRDTGVRDSEQECIRRAVSRESGALERRQRVIRETRRLIRQAGFDPDLLSTPAAGMSGL